MAKLIYDTTETITLERFKVAASAALDDLALSNLDVRTYHEEFLQRTIMQLRAYILADHMEHKEASYTHMYLPQWLKWMKRFIKIEERVLQLDAYATYPKSNIKLPKLGSDFVTFTKNDWRVDE